jgi:hypothetical protein
VACARCPNQKYYELLWADAAEPEVICVMLRCCAGPELQIRRGGTRLLCELFATPDAVRSRGEALKGAWLAVVEAAGQETVQNAVQNAAQGPGPGTV